MITIVEYLYQEVKRAKNYELAFVDDSYIVLRGTPKALHNITVIDDSYFKFIKELSSINIDETRHEA